MENQLFQRAKIVSVYNELTEDVFKGQPRPQLEIMRSLTKHLSKLYNLADLQLGARLAFKGGLRDIRAGSRKTQ